MLIFLILQRIEYIHTTSQNKAFVFLIIKNFKDRKSLNMSADSKARERSEQLGKSYRFMPLLPKNY